jgi:hypothetical protein
MAAASSRASHDAEMRGGGDHGAQIRQRRHHRAAAAWRSALILAPMGGEATLGFSRIMRIPRAAALGTAVLFVSSVGGSRPDLGCLWRSPDPTSGPSCEFEDMWLPVKIVI